MTVHLSQASWNLALNAALDTPLASGFLDIYDSTGTGQPATPDVAVTTQVKLAHLPLSATAFGAASAGGTVAAHLGGILVAASGRPIPVFPITFAASTALLSTLQSSRASTDMAANGTAALAMSPASTWMDRLGALPA